MPLIKLNTQSATTLDATKLTGNLPAISGASLTGVSAGKLLQYAVDNDGDFINLDNTNWVDTALSISFTPTASTSTIVVRGHVHCYVSGNSGSYHGMMGYKLQKDGSDFGEGFSIYSGYGGQQALINAPLPFNVQETAGSTSARTYKVQVRNASTQTGSSHNQYGGKSVLEILEIEA